MRPARPVSLIKIVSPLCLSLFLALVGTENAAANLVQNGNFDSVTYTPADANHPLTTVFGQFGTAPGTTLTLTNWSTTGYNFVFAPGTVDSGTTNGANAGQPKQAPSQTGTNGADGYGHTYLWGPNNGSANGLPTTSPAGGNFVAADGGLVTTGQQITAPITQSISGLVVGQKYQLSFQWAVGQQQSYNNGTSSNWTASLGSESYTTTTVSIPGKGFSGWFQQTFTYTATAANETLSFLAGGTPMGQPPFSLLDGVTLDAVVPEFSHWGVFAGFGVLCIAFESFRRRRRVPATT